MKNGAEDGIILRVKKVLLTCAIFLSCEQDSSQRLTLCPLFSDGMVLQRDTIVSLWGQCDPDQLVTLNSSWGVSDSTRSDQNGDWIAKISTTNETGPHTLTIKSGEWAKEIRDVLLERCGWQLDSQTWKWILIIAVTPQTMLFKSWQMQITQ